MIFEEYQGKGILEIDKQKERLGIYHLEYLKTNKEAFLFIAGL